MTLRHISPLFLAVSLLGCDLGSSDTTTMRESIADALEQADIPLSQAVAAAVAETGGVAIDAELETEHATPLFKVETYVDGGLVRVDIDIEDGSVVRTRASSSGNEEDNAANAELATGVDWALLIGAAEAEVGGEAFEIKADNGELEVEVLANDGIFEVELAADGTILKVEASDDDQGEDEDEDEGEDHHGGSDDDAGTDDDGGGHDDDAGTDDDGGSDDHGTDDDGGSDDNGGGSN